MNTTITTLCYMERDDKYLMLHRVKKQIDVNKGKWIGVGGKLELGESPEECLLREVREETSFILTGFRYRGLITFIYADKAPEYIFTYTSDSFCTQADMSDAAKTVNSESGMSAVNTENVDEYTNVQNDTNLHDNRYSELPVPECEEGIFAWIEKNRILTELELWEGDRYMLDYLLSDRTEPFSLKLCYDEQDRLIEAWELSASPVRIK